jgi:acyl carrier protein
MYVLDRRGAPVPLGIAGELHIGGSGLARGYLGRPELTQERFIPDPFGPPGSRLYRTGDLARWREDGTIDYLGRIDQQVKIRGVRIEPGEIEVALREHPGVQDAVVVVQDDGPNDKRLIAYAVPKRSPGPDAAALQQWLGAKLPKALIPSALLLLDQLPRTPNGKLDRRALPKFDARTVAETRPAPASGPTPVATTDLERQVLAIWSDVLGHPTIGLDDRFFDIGGHSLHMVEVHDKLRDQFGHDIPLLDLFQYPTVRSLARHIRQKTSSGATRTASVNRGKLRLQMQARQSSIRKSGSLRTKSGALIKAAAKPVSPHRAGPGKAP